MPVKQAVSLAAASPAASLASLSLSLASLTDFKIFKIILKGVWHSLK